MATHPMLPGSWSDIEDKPLLDEDAFQNEQSRRLFDAIDRLRSCGASQDIALPEVTQMSSSSNRSLTNLACHCWRPVCGKIFAPPKLDGHPFSSCKQCVHQVSDTNHLATEPGPARDNYSFY